jgi:hypothetical protein
MKKPLQVMIGFDRNESVAYHVLAHSIMKRASRPVSITPLYLPQLKGDGTYTRLRGSTESTEFSMTRFLTPYLMGFEGVSVFLDSDMLCMDDICKLESIALSDPYKDVFVVKHDYEPKTKIKFLGQQQTAYPCKNWSSLMVFNGHRSPVRTLTPEYVNAAPPSELHQFKWAQNVGELPSEWNHLVGEYMPDPNAKLIHFTIGGPWFSEYQNCEYSKEWHDEFMQAYLPHYPLIADPQCSMMQAASILHSEK